MSLSLDQVKKVAKLANLKLTDQEEQLCVTQLSRVLDYADQLKKVYTKDVEPLFNATDKQTWIGTSRSKAGALKIDGVIVDTFTEFGPEDPSPVTSLSAKQALANAKVQKNGLFVTKGVFEDE